MTGVPKEYFSLLLLNSLKAAEAEALGSGEGAEAEVRVAVGPFGRKVIEIPNIAGRDTNAVPM